MITRRVQILIPIILGVGAEALKAIPRRQEILLCKLSEAQGEDIPKHLPMVRTRPAIGMESQTSLSRAEAEDEAVVTRHPSNLLLILTRISMRV
jgi:hypothetical protein